MGRSGPNCFHQSLWDLLVPKIVHPILEEKVCRKCVLVFAARSEGSGLEEGKLRLFLSALPERLHVVQFLPTELVSGQCLHKLNSQMWQMVFVWRACSQLHAVTLHEGAEKGEPLERTAGDGCWFGGKVPGLAGGQSVRPGRLQLIVAETTLRSTSKTQRQPNELPWDQRRLAKFGAIQKATELSKAIPASKGLTPRSQREEERFVWKTVSFSFTLMWSLGIFCNLKAGLFIYFFHIIYPFFSLKAFCLLTLSSYRMRSRQIQIELLLPFYKSVISGHLVFL